MTHQFYVSIHASKRTLYLAETAQQAAVEAAGTYDILNQEELSRSGMSRIAVVTGPDGVEEVFRVKARTQFIAEPMPR